jgi:hypothetical protein
VRLAAACFGLLASVSAAGQQGGARVPPEPPGLTTPRYDEDYSYLRDPAKRSGAWWEPLKYIPLDFDGSAYLTLGDELRWRYERYWNTDFGSAVRPDEGYNRYREVPYADLHLGPDFRAFGQLMIAYGDRNSQTKNPFTDETGVEILQGFADWHVHLGDAGELSLRGGRQVMVYGSGRLINAGPNIRTSFDGGLIRWETGLWRVDGFYVRPVKPEFDPFNDHPDDARAVWSVYASRALPALGPRAVLDLIYIGYENDFASFNQGGGREIRHTIGARFFGVREPWDWDFEAHYQFGTFDRGDIRAWDVATQIGYTFVDLPLKPFVGLRATAISGDRNPDDHALQTFNPMFPLGGYFGESGVIGPYNLLSLHPAVGIDLGSGWSLSGAMVFYWRESLGDGIYGFGGNLIRPSGGSRARYIGTQADVALGWEVNRNLSFYVGYSVVVPGQFVADTGPAEPIHFIGAQVMFRF